MILIGYVIFKIFKINIYKSFFYKYDKITQKILRKYGDFKITKVYSVKEPLNMLILKIFNLFTFYKHSKEFDKNKNKEKFLQHSSLIIEIRLKNNRKKLLLLEKNTCVFIRENIHINKYMIVDSIKLNNDKQFSLNELLTITKDRIGLTNFFCWNLDKNNCQNFIYELLITLSNNKNINDKKKHDLNKFLKKIDTSELVLYFINNLVVNYNLIIKNICDTFIF
jgi:hypothetical protein